MKLTVITLSDRASQGIYEDISGKIIIDMIHEAYPEAELHKIIIPDDQEVLLNSLNSMLDQDFVITTGGTGLSVRDITPEVCASFCDKELPGIAEIIRSESYKETQMAMLSRNYAGMKGKTIIINFPGSTKAVKLCSKIVIPILEHAIMMRDGIGH